jgi:hypothetical protein
LDHEHALGGVLAFAEELGVQPICSYAHSKCFAKFVVRLQLVRRKKTGCFLKSVAASKWLPPIRKMDPRFIVSPSVNSRRPTPTAEEVRPARLDTPANAAYTM